jgi:hypothetical protein
MANRSSIENFVEFGTGYLLVQSRKLKHGMGGDKRRFKSLGKRSDSDNFILISMCGWVFGSRWYTSDCDVVTIDF